MISTALDERRRALWHRYEPRLRGANLYVAVQTAAELRYGALVAGWGDRRMADLNALIEELTIIEIDDELVWEHARLRLACRRAGHALAGSAHAADLWVAASAIHLGIPLVADDAVFEDVPRLDLIRDPG